MTDGSSQIEPSGGACFVWLAWAKHDGKQMGKNHALKSLAWSGDAKPNEYQLVAFAGNLLTAQYREFPERR